MMVQVPIPSGKDLRQAYDLLQSHRIISAPQIVKVVQWSRFDPRLFEILATYLAKHYERINPFDLNFQMLLGEWSPALGALLSHSRLLLTEREMFDHWSQICLHKIPKGNEELYFIGLFNFQMKRLSKMILRPSKLFRDWGYLHDEIVLNKSEQLNKTTIKKPQRIQFLKQLLKGNPKISLKEYRHALNFQISVRQAQRDLKAFT